MALESTLEIPGLTTPLLTGAITTAEVSEIGGVAPATVIRTDQDWQIKVNWNLEGSLLGTPFFSFMGDWIVRMFLESIGPGVEHELPAGGTGLRINVDNFTPDGPTKRDYTATIPVAPNAVQPGIYKMAIAVTYESTPGTPGPIAGFHEGGMLQLYKPS